VLEAALEARKRYEGVTYGEDQERWRRMMELHMQCMQLRFFQKLGAQMDDSDHFDAYTREEQLFDFIDLDMTGTITLDELRAFLLETQQVLVFGQWLDVQMVFPDEDGRMKDECIRSFFRVVDSDRDNSIGRQEFLRVYDTFVGEYIKFYTCRRVGSRTSG